MRLLQICWASLVKVIRYCLVLILNIKGIGLMLYPFCIIDRNEFGCILCIRKGVVATAYTFKSLVKKTLQGRVGFAVLCLFRTKRRRTD